MNKIQIAIPLTFFLIVLISSFEYFYLNAEGIFIISFLLFTFCFYFFVGDSIGALLDETSDDIQRKLKELSILQKQALRANKETLNRIRDLNKKILPLIVYFVSVLETREKVYTVMQKAIYRNFIEKKCKEVLIERSLLNVDINNFFIKEVLRDFESKIR